MLRKIMPYSIFATLLISTLVFLTWLCWPDPKFNPASFESEALVQSIADPDTALTLAQYRADTGEVVTLLVDAIHEGEIRLSENKRV